MATTSSSLTSPFAQNYHLNAQRTSLPCSRPPPPRRPSYRPAWAFSIKCHFAPTWTTKPVCEVSCKATEVSVAEESPSSGEGGNGGGGAENWVPVVPLAALPKGERRVITQDDVTILLLWYKDEVFAIENRSPAEGAYSEGLLNAKLTQVLFFLCFVLLFLYVSKLFHILFHVGR
uniref:Rieske-like [2Fe-2S] domain-containing protein n=1 Tax=Rhizophora mucronata TaxID=61149 RepID=A0A2P2IUR6_RHIMU